MKKYGACVAALAAATLIGPTALAVAHPHATKHHAKKHNVVRKYHVVIVKHVIHHAKAFVASCPPGTGAGAPPSYCTAPAVQTVYETFSSSTSASATVSTSNANELLLASVQSSGPSTGGQSSTVSGGGLTWHKVAAENKEGGDAEVWYALATSTISKQKITATASITGYPENLTLVTLTNASGIGASGTFYSASGAPTGTITTTQPDSWVWASANDPANDVLRKVPSGQNAWVQALFSSTTGKTTVKGTFWTQSTTNPTPNGNTPVTINDTAPTTDPYNLVLVEIL
jgi:hypothetical protein